MKKYKTILFGGTFDPVHIAHTEVARESAIKIGAEKVIFIPAKKSPLKQSGPAASDRDRLNMIKLAIAGCPEFKVSDYELQKAGPSFTIVTVRFFKELLGGNTEIYWLMGADNITELGNWYKIDELIDECNLAVMYRAGFEKPDFSGLKARFGERHIAKLENNVVATPLIDISSTEIRRRIAAGEDVNNMLSPQVLNYICNHNLYRSQ
jgi:nicotinate-nucleotide adenylyltransferase